MEENQEESLSQLFDKGLSLHNEVLDSTEETKSEAFQDSVKKGILMLEDATRLVSLLDVFSRNENYSELPTEHLKFFLLPVLLGMIYTTVHYIKSHISTSCFRGSKQQTPGE